MKKNKSKINVAVVGQPNCGKSTMFNAITGSTARVGNYPGITVDHMEGYYKNDNFKIKFTDLPGTYSLSSYSMEEIVTRNFIFDNDPDIILCMLDTVALERSLYLVIQIMEMGKPVVIGLNMMDEIEKSGIKLDSNKLAKTLGVPVVECIARRGKGKKEIIEEITKLHESKNCNSHLLNISYGNDLSPVIGEMTELIENNNFLEKYPSKWVAVKYLEEDEKILEQGQSIPEVHENLIKKVKKVSKHTELTLNTYPEAIVADYRYGFIQSLLKQNIIDRTHIHKHSTTEQVDKILTHRVLGPVIMILVLYFLFLITFNLGAYPQAWLEDLFGWIGSIFNSYITNNMLKSLVVSGIIDGVGAVLSFSPLILIMFGMLCFLEDLGYMARIAYMLDRVFKAFGLHGASVMPFIVAGGIPGGCAVPGVMTARTLRSPKERIATVLTAPFMVCGAKATVFLMLCKAFFSNNATTAMLIITIASWIIALIIAKILRVTVVRGEPTPFLMELPPYRMPTFYGVFTHTLERIWQFVKKAGTIIFAISIVMWALMTFPKLPEKQVQKYEIQKNAAIKVIDANKELSKGAKEELSKAITARINSARQGAALVYSIGGRIGKKMEVITKYCGFNWQINIALLGGFAAKEVIISTLSTAYSMKSDEKVTNVKSLVKEEISKLKNGTLIQADDDESQGLSDILRADSTWTWPAIISLLIVVMLYSPCMATVPAMVKETSWKYTVFGIIGSLAITYALCVAVYQIGSIFL